MEGEGPGVGEQAVEEEEEEEEDEKAAESLLFSVATCSSRGSHSEIWTSFLWFFLVFSVWVLPVESWVIGFLGDGFYIVFVFFALLGPMDTRTCVSLRDMCMVSFFGGFPRTPCIWQSLVLRSLVEYSIVDFSGR